jgi:hypothetical protein
LLLHNNEAAVAVALGAVVPAAVILEAITLAALILEAADRTVISTVDRMDALVGREVISADRTVISSLEGLSTTHSGDRSTRMGIGIRMGMDIRTGRTIIRRTSLGT